MRRHAVLSALVALLVPTLSVAADPAAKKQDTSAEMAALKKRVAELEKRLAPPELGQQMLEIQIRHARLWYAGEAQNWLLSTFHLHELDEALEGVVEKNPDHAALQPKRLADELPAIMKPAIKAVRDALDKSDKAAFEAAYDRLSAACTRCHQVAGNSFLIIERPKTPLLDNLRVAPPTPPARP
jgi:hypothetical protein